MNTYIALLRGINVGGRNTLPMSELRALLESMGFENVRTYIQSGNVVYESGNELGPEDAARISSRVLAEKGFEPKVLLLSESDLLDAVRNNPFPTSDGRALHFLFIAAAPTSPNAEPLAAFSAPSEEYALGAGVFYLHAPNGIGRSKLAASVEKVLGVPVTARNWNTVSKLVSMVE